MVIKPSFTCVLVVYITDRFLSGYTLIYVRLKTLNHMKCKTQKNDRKAKQKHFCASNAKPIQFAHKLSVLHFNWSIPSLGTVESLKS